MRLRHENSRGKTGIKLIWKKRKIIKYKQSKQNVTLPTHFLAHLDISASKITFSLTLKLKNVDKILIFFANISKMKRRLLVSGPLHEQKLSNIPPSWMSRFSSVKTNGASSPDYIYVTGLNTLWKCLWSKSIGSKNFIATAPFEKFIDCQVATLVEV